MSVDYDKSEIRTFADMLYAKAESIVLMTTIMYGIGGLIFGIPIGGFFGRNVTGFTMIIGGSLGAWLGYEIGTYKAFGLKLQAQTSLCQVQIEINTAEMAKNITTTSKMLKKSLDAEPELQELGKSKKPEMKDASIPDPKIPSAIDDLTNLTPHEEQIFKLWGKDVMLNDRMKRLNGTMMDNDIVDNDKP